MQKAQFLAIGSVQGFINWLAPRIAGATAINFTNPRPGGAGYRYLQDALAGYSWPLKRQVIHLPTGAITLPAGSNLSANTTALTTITSGLRPTLTGGNNPGFAAWAKCVMEWGGVQNHNNSWITHNTPTICQIVTNVNDAIARADDVIGVHNLRFNSGMTKLYSLLNNNFIIYDSRVAAALAWLVFDWSGAVVPHELAFRCMPARKTLRQKRRNPDINQFCWVNNDPYQHFKWNVRANWVLEAAFSKASENGTIPYGNLRDVEAALFMLGEDLP